MSTIQTNAVISPTGELTIKLPHGIAPAGTSVEVHIILPPIDLNDPDRLPSTNTPHPEWSQEYLNQVLGGWLGEAPQRPEPLFWKERHLW